MASNLNKMISRNLILCLVFTILPSQTSAQDIDNTASSKNINADSYIRLYVDNDYFTGTDEQYTEGLNLELVMPWIRKFPLSRLLVHPLFTHIRYGIGVEQACYTPDYLQNQSLQTYGRPFAGTLFLKTFLIATDSVKKQWFATTLSTGVIGPASQAGRIQDNFHALIQDVQPPGWKYQIRNDAILNYQVNYEKQFLSYGNYFIADGEGMARAGTLSDKAGVGINVMAGYFQSPFSVTGRFSSECQVYVFDNPEVDVVGYDATLQGGLFDRSSPYTIPAADISRIVFINHAGLALAINHWYLAYNEYYLAPQFSTGPYHLWGGIQVALAIDRKKNNT